MAKSRVGFSLLDARCCFNFGGKVLERGCNGNPYFWKLSWWQPGGWSLINWSPVSVTTNLFLGLHLTFQSDTSTNTTFIKWVSSKLQKNQEHKFQNQVSEMSGLVDQRKGWLVRMWYVISLNALLSENIAFLLELLLCLCICHHHLDSFRGNMSNEVFMRCLIIMLGD